jgi:hypothetical protein
MVASSAGQTGIVRIIARSAAMVTGRASAALKAALQISTISSAIGRVAFIGKVALNARSKAISGSIAAISTLTAGFVAMFASSQSGAVGRALSIVTLKLVSRGSGGSSTSAKLGGKVLFFAQSAATIAGRAIMIFKASLSAISLGAGKGIGIFAGFVKFASSAGANSRARAAASFVAGLISSSSGYGKAKAPVTGILTLTTAATKLQCCAAILIRAAHCAFGIWPVNWKFACSSFSQACDFH